jgi:putative component of membrane protein insertase Oxa1/YidC/SpoIIIJ protein YidD
MVSQIALGAIWGYQRWISPRKGWRCAHSVLHGGTGCSGHAKHAIRNHGFWAAIPIIRQRLRDCRAARDTLQASCAVHAVHPGDEIKDVADEDGSRKRAAEAGAKGKSRESDADKCEDCTGLCVDGGRLGSRGLCNCGANFCG